MKVVGRLSKDEADVDYLNRIACNLLDRCSSACIPNNSTVIRLNTKAASFEADLKLLLDKYDLRGIKVVCYE